MLPEPNKRHLLWIGEHRAYLGHRGFVNEVRRSSFPPSLLWWGTVALEVLDDRAEFKQRLIDSIEKRLRVTLVLTRGAQCHWIHQGRKVPGPDTAIDLVPLRLNTLQEVNKPVLPLFEYGACRELRALGAVRGRFGEPLQLRHEGLIVE